MKILEIEKNVVNLLDLSIDDLKTIKSSLQHFLNTTQNEKAKNILKIFEEEEVKNKKIDSNQLLIFEFS